MDTQNKRNINTPSPSVSRSCSAVANVQAAVENMIDADCFDSSDTGIICEIVLAITEVLSLPEHYDIKIGKGWLPGNLVQGIFGKLRHQHVMHVIEKIRSGNAEIKNMKMYIRTLLYNEVFENESKIANMYSVNNK